jgi:thioredoxin reductase
MRVAILGAGPAGMSCANGCLSFGLTPIVVERSDHVGGTQRSNFHPSLWMLGFPDESGQDMTRRISDHFLGLGVETHLECRITRVEKTREGFRLHLEGAEGGQSIGAGAVVLATGMRPWATPELLELAGRTRRVIVGPLSDAIRDEVRDAHVMVLGGGDNALDHALFLAERGNTVKVCTRGGFSARKAFREACTDRPGIELRQDCRPMRLEAGRDRIRVTWNGGGETVDWLLVMYGYRPSLDVLERFDAEIRPALTPKGYVQVDPWQRTSVAGLYAAGDLTDTPQPSVPAAIAQGLAAARAIERDHLVL